jgi:riboflavin kinase/FMN adenylyltransferase
MKIIRYPQQRPLAEPCCLTIGNFDGVHLGHQALIRAVTSQAAARGMQSCVVTMQPLPLQFFSGRYAVDVLTGFTHKARIMARHQLDVLCVLNFNAGLAQMPARDFFEQIVKHGLKARYVLVGDDFRFGKGRQGGYAELAEWGAETGIEVAQLEPVLMAGERVSSSRIRQLLKAGDLPAANQLLGRTFNIRGRVAHGRKMGRELGFPTLNIELRNGGFPLHGVYVTRVRIGQRWYQSVTSVGHNPTVGGNAKRAEVHVFDFSGDVYGKTVEVLFYQKLRNEVEFDSLGDLTAAIEQDVRAGHDFFARNEGELE